MEAPWRAVALVLLLPWLAGAAAAESVGMTVEVANALPAVLGAGGGSGVLWVEGADANGGEDLVAGRFVLEDGTVLAAAPGPAAGETRRFEAAAEGVEGEVRAIVEDYFGASAAQNMTIAPPAPASAHPSRPIGTGGLQALGERVREVPGAPAVALLALAAAAAALAARRLR